MKKMFLIMVLVLVSMSLNSCFFTKKNTSDISSTTSTVTTTLMEDNEQITSKNTPSVSSTSLSTATPTVQTTLDTSDLSEYSVVFNNNSISIHDKMKDIQENLGEPISIEKKDSDGISYAIYKYSDLSLKAMYFEDPDSNSIFEIQVESNEFKTKRGITIGDSINKLKNLYPEVESTTLYPDIEAYSYNNEPSNDVNPSLIYFAYKNDKITWIKMENLFP